MNLEVIEQPHVKLDFLRYKVGRKVKRPTEAPNMIDGKIVGWRKLSTKTEVFELLGWGSTREKAELMAARALMRLEAE